MQCNKYSAIVWNNCLKVDKESKEKIDRSLTRSELQFLMKKSVPYILANSINIVIFKYVTARDSMWKSIRAKHKESNKVRLPYKEKKFYNTGWTSQNIKIYKDRGYITLSKPVLPDENGINRKQKPIKCYIKNIPENIVEIELLYKKGLKLAI
jgi:putative transposase